MKAFPLVVVLLFTGIAATGEPLLVSWQNRNKWSLGFTDDMTVEAVRFADTNGFDFVRFAVDDKTALRPLLAAVGDRLGVWIDFSSYSAPLGKRVRKELEAAGIGTNRVFLATDKRWGLEDLKTHNSEYRRVWSGRLDYHHASGRWRVWGLGPHGPVYRQNAAEVAASIEPFAKKYGLWGVEFHSRGFMVEPGVIESLHAADIKVALDDVNDPVTGDYYRKAGADAFITALPSSTRGGVWPPGEPKKVTYIGHRGGEDHLAPQHSLAMARLAAQKHLEIVKLDIHETKDGEIVTSHDHTLKHVYGVDLAIRDHDYAELSRYEAKPVNCISNQHLATLRQVLSILKKDIGEFWIDFKYFSPQCAEKTLAAIDEAGIAHSRVMVATFQQPALEYMLEHHPEIRRVLHIQMYRKADRWRVGYSAATFADIDGALGEIDRRRRKFKLYGVNMPASFGKTDYETVGKLKKMGLWVSIYQPENPVTADYYRRAGVDAFVTGCIRSCELRGQ